MLGHILQVMKQRMRGLPRTPSELNNSLQFLSVMRGLGWHESIRRGYPVDEQGEPLPWYTYSALEWVKPRVKKTDAVFEYGAGYSTIWYGRHVRQVISVEDYVLWLEKVRPMVGSNVTLLHRISSTGTPTSCERNSAYASAIEEYPPASFDIIVVDGKERSKCASMAASRLREDGIIIFDNSDWPQCKAGVDCLHSQGFGRIDFYGSVAQVGTRNCTSVFSKFGTRWTSENIPLINQTALLRG